MTGPFGEALRLLGKGITWILADSSRTTFVTYSAQNLARSYSTHRALKKHRREILKTDKVSAAAETIRATLDDRQAAELRRTWESALASHSTPVPDGQITLVIKGADAVSHNPAIAQMLDEMLPVGSQEPANRRILFVIALFFVYLAAMAGLDTRDWDHYLSTAAFLAHAVLSARPEEPETPPESDE
ncbi:hypothetical protein SK854_42250 [Lentzea sp. BCCO 10_0061]|uniref:TetR family transcriptional regulator n=1 Tax=Lentzea sokolovensis TaxID=3095429 RepID=A0ABU4VAT1_9PSEU|nr:hypothetical protein [Lentzea sp. BCCO 10_0061]MDX8148799.1 hypothetical protein [Lentzea sp. BCCO 10_0061]